MEKDSGDVIVDGVSVQRSSATVPVFDIALLRGYGCFEALRSYGGVAFRIDGHLDRLEMSAAALGLPLPPRRDLDEWVRRKASDIGDGRVRVVVTGGVDDLRPGIQTHTVVFGEPLPHVPPAFRLLPVKAPWHSAGLEYRLTGVKSTSYAPNMSAMLEARSAGYDDALLLGRDGEVLEGPTYSIGWVAGGVVMTPTLDLGILESITRQVAIEAAAAVGLTLREVTASIDEVVAADEVFVMSTVREIGAVIALGDTAFAEGPITAGLARAFHEIVAAETAAA